jgi:uncharacterized protein YbjT (DUF2867 family)
VDAPFGLVDLEDVAEAAATVLADEAHGGATYELGGPALVSVRNVAVAAEEALGGVVRLERIPPENFRPDVDDRTRDWLLQMFDYYDQHGLPAGPLPLGALLDRPPVPVAAVLARELGPG